MLFPSAALVKRELIRDLRRPRSFVCLGLFVAVCILVAIANYPPEHARNMAAASHFSREFVRMVTLTLVAGAALFMPGLAGSTIVVEKEQRTFDLLHLTLIRPHRIVIAKLLNTLGLLMLLTLAVMPVLGVVFFLVGIDWAQLALMLMVLTAATFSCAMVGILCSARFARTTVAIIASYVGMVTVMGAPVLLVYICAAIGRSTGLGYIHIPRQFEAAFSPFAAVLYSDLVPYVLLCIAYQTAFAFASFFLTLRILRRPPRTAIVITRKPIDDAALLEARRKEFPFYLIDPLRRKEPIEDKRNPMLVKELRWGAMGRSTALIRVFYTAFIVYFLLGAIVVLTTVYSTRYTGNFTGSVFMWLIMQIYLTVIIAPTLLANALTKEYELGNVDMLRMTLLTPRDIVLGKVVAGAVSLSPLILAALLSSAPLVFVGLFFPGCLSLLLTGYVTLLVCAFVSLSLGLFASSITRRTGASVVLSYLFNIMVLGGFTFICLLISDAIRSPPYSLAPLPSERVGHFLSPIAAFWAGSLYYRHWRLGDSALNWYWLGNVATFTLLSLGIIWFCVVRFARVGMRDR